MKITRLDHLVLTVRDIQKSCAFYTQILEMEHVTFEGDRQALIFGTQKINLHAAGHEFEPKAQYPVPGSADLCFVTDLPVADFVTHAQHHGVELEMGPVLRTGAIGPIESVYVRDPDGNQVEFYVDNRDYDWRRDQDWMQRPPRPIEWP